MTYTRESDPSFIPSHRLRLLFIRFSLWCRNIPTFKWRLRKRLTLLLVNKGYQYSLTVKVFLTLLPCARSYWDIIHRLQEVRLYFLWYRLRSLKTYAGVPHSASEDSIQGGYFIPKGAILSPNVWWVFGNERKCGCQLWHLPSQGDDKRFCHLSWSRKVWPLSFPIRYASTRSNETCVRFRTKVWPRIFRCKTESWTTSM